MKLEVEDNLYTKTDIFSMISLVRDTYSKIITIEYKYVQSKVSNLC